MITKHDIKNAEDTFELEHLINQAACDRNCEVDHTLSYQEQADFLREEAKKQDSASMFELSDLLEQAELRFYKITS